MFTRAWFLLCASLALANGDDPMEISADDFKTMTGVDAEEWIGQAGVEGDNTDAGEEPEDEDENGEVGEYEMSDAELDAFRGLVDKDGDDMLSKKELALFAKATGLTLAKSDLYRDKFINEADHDGDGFLQLQSEIPDEASGLERLRMAAADVNGDGRLSDKELSYSLAPELNKQVLEKALGSLFQKLDKDADGKVQKSEFQESLDQLLAEGERRDGAFATLDADKDGKLSKQELVPFVSGRLGHEMMFARVISRGDENKDGQISKDELQAFGNAFAQTAVAENLEL